MIKGIYYELRKEEYNTPAAWWLDDWYRFRKKWYEHNQNILIAILNGAPILGQGYHPDKENIDHVTTKQVHLL